MRNKYQDVCERKYDRRAAYRSWLVFDLLAQGRPVLLTMLFLAATSPAAKPKRPKLHFAAGQQARVLLLRGAFQSGQDHIP